MAWPARICRLLPGGKRGVYLQRPARPRSRPRPPPEKTRPLASGRVTPGTAKILYAALVVPALLLAFQVSHGAAGFVAAYLFINILYSLALKRIVILDVFTISAGFMLRILAGTVGLAIVPSAWLLLCGLMLTLFLGFSKRAELLLLESDSVSAPGRIVLQDYSAAVLDQFISVTASCTILAYGLYTVSPQTIALHGDGRLIYTLPFVIFGILRYMLTLRARTTGHDAAKDLMTDPHLLVTVAGWLLVTIWILA